MTQKTKKMLQDRKYLEDAYFKKFKSYSEIGKMVGVSKHAVYRAFKRHGIKGRIHTSKFPQLNNKDWLRSVYLDQKKSIKEIALLVGCSPGAIGSALVWSGIKTRTIKQGVENKYPDGRYGEKASNWRGGRVKTTNGHIYVYQPEHPHCNRAGRVMEHRLVMEKHLGRYLAPEEIVHHKNGNKEDNRIENLDLCKNRKEHVQKHFNAVKEVYRLRKILEEHGIEYKLT